MDFLEKEVCAMRLENCTYDVLYPIICKFKNEVGPMTVCFLLTHVPNPRMNKRIEVFKSQADTHIICTRRASQNVWEPTQDVDHVIFDIDLPSAKHILKRYVVSQNFQKKALEQLEQLKPNVIYAEGLDTLIIAGKYKKNHDVRIMFEVADLRENYITKPKKAIDRIITAMLLQREKKAFKNVDFLVVTSPKFYDMHYNTLISKDKMLFIPNAPDVEVFKDYTKHDGEFTVGFIGGIRYLQQMKMLVDAAGIAGCKVLFAGAGGTSTDYEEIQAYCKGKNYVQFTGRYDYNTQISGLYGMVDCVFAVYDADNPNVRIALPNKLYESILCELPIIVAKDTYLAELVESWGVGVAVDHKSLNDLVIAINNLKNDNEMYDKIVEQCRKRKNSIDLEKNNQLFLQRINNMLS